jgi:hypothetical protein
VDREVWAGFVLDILLESDPIFDTFGLTVLQGRRRVRRPHREEPRREELFGSFGERKSGPQFMGIQGVQ